MAELLRMPEVAAGATSAVLSQWPVAPGSAFSAGDVIAIIETDKAVVDVEAESDGILVHVIVPDGTEVAIGDPIALIAAADEVVDDVTAALDALGVSATPERPQPSASPTAPDTTSVVSESVMPRSDASRLFVSPIARRLAKEAGISLEGVVGSGPNGRIRRRDVEALIAAGPSARPTAPAPEVVGVTEFVDVPHSRLRRAIATRLVESKTTAPHFYLRGSANVDRLMALRAEMNHGEELRVSVNDLVIKAVAVAHTRVPGMNVIWTPDALRQFSSVDIAVAIATDNGLVTPVLRGVERLSVTEIARSTKDFAARARSGGLRQNELEGGSTSVTNLGMFGTEDFDAIINPPHSSILAVGAARKQPVVKDDEITVGTVMKVSLSVDHRPIDGAVAAEWMREFLALLEQPAKIVA